MCRVTDKELSSLEGAAVFYGPSSFVGGDINELIPSVSLASTGYGKQMRSTFPSGPEGGRGLRLSLFLFGGQELSTSSLGFALSYHSAAGGERSDIWNWQPPVAPLSSGGSEGGGPRASAGTTEGIPSPPTEKAHAWVQGEWRILSQELQLVGRVPVQTKAGRKMRRVGQADREQGRGWRGRSPEPDSGVASFNKLDRKGTWLRKHAQKNLHPRICNVGLQWKHIAFCLEAPISLSPTFPIM